MNVPGTFLARAIALAALAGALFAPASVASARPAVATAQGVQAQVEPAPTCILHSLPSFIAQGEFGLEGTVGDVVEFECNPSEYAPGTTVEISDAQLFSRCAGGITWYVPNEFGTDEFREERDSRGVEVGLNADGSATVALIAGPHCAAGDTVLSAHMNESFSTSFDVVAPHPTEQGLFTTPSEQVEDPGSSSVAAIVQAEFPGRSEAMVRIAAPELYSRCEVAPHLLWVRENKEAVAGAELVGGSAREPAGGEAIRLDNDGNGFVIALGAASCRPGRSVIEADLENAPFTTLLSEFVVLPPQPTAEPSFSIQKLQRVAGSGTGFTTSQVTGVVGQTVEYEIVLTNTGTVPENFTEFSDPHCEAGTLKGGPGASSVGPGESTTYTCTRALSASGIYTNEAAVTGTTVGGTPIKGVSNEVEVVVSEVPRPEFTILKLQEIAGSGTGFTTEKLKATIGQTVDYEIEVTNTGNTSLTFSEFKDSICEPGTIGGGSGNTPIPPKGDTIYTCSLKLTATGKYVNVASITADPGAEGITKTSEPVETVVPAEPGFKVEKLQEIAGSGTGFTTKELTGAIGETIDYEIEVENTGNTPLTFTTFADSLCESATISGGSTSPIAPSGTAVYTCSLKLTGPGKYTNVAQVTATPPEGPEITHPSPPVTTVVPGQPGFKVEKLQEIAGSGKGFTTSELTGAIGQTVDYEIRVENTGTTPLTFTTFTDTLCESATISGGSTSPIAPMGTTVYTCSLKLTATGKYTNIAYVTAKPEEGSEMSEGSDPVVVAVPAEVKPNPQPQPQPTTTTTTTTTVTATSGTKSSAVCAISKPQLRGVSGPKRGSFKARVAAAGIESITFYLDGRKLKTLTKSQARGGFFTVSVNPRKLSYGAHRLSFKTVMESANCSNVASSAVFVRPHPARVKPKFTG